MRKLNLCLCLFLIAVFTRCSKTPTAGFEMDKELYYLGDTIHFKNTSTEALSYRWTFPDGSTSSEKEPIFIVPEDLREPSAIIQMEAYSKKERKSNVLARSVNLSIPLFKTDFFEAPPDRYIPRIKTANPPSTSYYNYYYTVTFWNFPLADNTDSELTFYFMVNGRPAPGVYSFGSQVRLELRKNVNQGVVSIYEAQNGSTMVLQAAPNNYLRIVLVNVPLRSYTQNYYSSLGNADLLF